MFNQVTGQSTEIYFKTFCRVGKDSGSSYAPINKERKKQGMVLISPISFSASGPKNGRHD